MAVLPAMGVPQEGAGAPRLHPLTEQPWGGQMGALIDPDGTLVRVIQN